MQRQSLFADDPWPDIHEELKFHFYKWKDTFVTAGCNPGLITNVLGKHMIENYDNLYQSFIRLPTDRRQNISNLWELFCLSGEKIAFLYLTNFKKLTKNTRNASGENALHYAALSTNPSQIYRALELGIPWNSTSDNHFNLLHFATLSGKVNQVNNVLGFEEKFKEKLPRVADNGINVFHLAALTGCVEIIELCKDLVEDLQACDNQGLNALDYARISNNEAAIAKLTALGLVDHRPYLSV